LPHGPAPVDNLDEARALGALSTPATTGLPWRGACRRPGTRVDAKERPQREKEALTTNGYSISADIDPVLDAYVTEGASFIALRLKPGVGVQQMTPVRLISPGASPIMPLRMVAAGTGAAVSLVLYVIGEGRYGAVDRPAAKDGLADECGPVAKALDTMDPTTQVVAPCEGEPNCSPPEGSMPSTLLACNGYSDIAAALIGMHPRDVWITRLEANLPRTALETDLTVGAESEQASVTNWMVAA
jgi:hypothetical protein